MHPTQVRRKLLEYAKARRIEFQTVLEDYARERFVARLATRVDLLPHFALKGGYLLHTLLDGDFRPTRDVDFGFWRKPFDPTLLGLAPAPPTIDGAEKRLTSAVVELIASIARIQLDDGVTFDPDSVRTEPIRDGQRYGGERLRVKVALETARYEIKLDVAEGDDVVPDPIGVQIPSMLALPASLLLAIPAPTVVAEKLDAIIELGLGNTRLKDYFDLWLLARRERFERAMLLRAFQATRTRRGRAAVPIAVDGLSSRYADSHASLWRSKWKARADDCELLDVIDAITRFARPILVGDGGPATWPPGGPWEHRR